jgi:hypothetical protein
MSGVAHTRRRTGIFSRRCFFNRTRSRLCLRRWSIFGRIALVTDMAWIRDAARLFAPFSPRTIRGWPRGAPCRLVALRAPPFLDRSSIETRTAAGRLDGRRGRFVAAADRARVKDSPSLRSYAGEVLSEAYRYAIRNKAIRAANRLVLGYGVACFALKRRFSGGPTDRGQTNPPQRHEGHEGTQTALSFFVPFAVNFESLLGWTIR